MPRNKTQAEATAELVEHFKRCFNGPDGKIVMAHLFAKYWGRHSTYVDGNPQRSAMQEGQRSVVIDIVETVLGKAITPSDVGAIKSILEQFHPEEE